MRVHVCVCASVPAQVKGLKVLGKTVTSVTLQWNAPPAYNDDIIAYTVRTHTCAHAHVCMHTYTHTYTHMRVRSAPPAYNDDIIAYGTHAYVYTLAHVHMHTYSCTHTTHTHTCTLCAGPRTMDTTSRIVNARML